MVAGYTEEQADKRRDWVGSRAAKAKDHTEWLRRIVTDSSEVADAVDEALEAIGKAELAAEVVIERRQR